MEYGWCLVLVGNGQRVCLSNTEPALGIAMSSYSIAILLCLPLKKYRHEAKRRLYVAMQIMVLLREAKSSPRRKVYYAEPVKENAALKSPERMKEEVQCR